MSIYDVSPCGYGLFQPKDSVNLCQPLSTHYILQIWLVSNQLSVVSVVIAKMCALYFR